MEDDADGLVLGGGDRGAQPLRPRDRVHLGAAFSDRHRGAVAELVDQWIVLADAGVGDEPGRRLELDVAARQRPCGRQAGREARAVLHHADLVFVGDDPFSAGVGVRLALRHPEGDVLGGRSRRAHRPGDARRVAETRQVVLELLDAAGGDVARAAVGDVDPRDGAGVDERPRSRAVARPPRGGFVDGHRRGGHVAGAVGVEPDAQDVDRRRGRGARSGIVDRVHDRAVEDGHAGSRRVAGSRVVDDDRGDRAGDRVERGMGRGLRPVRVVRRVEVHGREGVTEAGSVDRDRVDAAVGGRRRRRGGAAARERDDGLVVLGARVGHGDRGDGGAGRDDGVGGGSGAGAGDEDIRGRVAGPGVGERDAGDDAVRAVRDPTVACAVAVTSWLPVVVMVTVASGSVSGLRAQLGFGPK